MSQDSEDFEDVPVVGIACPPVNMDGTIARAVELSDGRQVAETWDGTRWARGRVSVESVMSSFYATRQELRDAAVPESDWPDGAMDTGR